MEYRLGVDRVAVSGDDTDFPYPIKLEYDDEYVYLTLLRMPTPEEIAKISPRISRWEEASSTLEQFYRQVRECEFWLCVETLEPSVNHGRLDNVVESYDGSVIRKRKFMCETKYRFDYDFSLSGEGQPWDACVINEEGVVRNPEIGVKYRFEKDSVLNRLARSIIGYDDPTVYSTIRGSLRIGSYQDLNFLFAERTGIYSNPAKIYYTKE